MKGKYFVELKPAPPPPNYEVYAHMGTLCLVVAATIFVVYYSPFSWR